MMSQKCRQTPAPTPGKKQIRRTAPRQGDDLSAYNILVGGAVFSLALLTVALTGSDGQVTHRALVDKRFKGFISEQHRKGGEKWNPPRGWSKRDTVLKKAFKKMEVAYGKDLDELKRAFVGRTDSEETTARLQKTDADPADLWSLQVAAIKAMLLERSTKIKEAQPVLDELAKRVEAAAASLAETAKKQYGMDVDLKNDKVNEKLAGDSARPVEAKTVQVQPPPPAHRKDESVPIPSPQVPKLEEPKLEDNEEPALEDMTQSQLIEKIRKLTAQ